jgi:hypothetical protein
VVAPVVLGVIGFLAGGGALPIGALSALPAGVIADAEGIDRVAATVAAYAPAVCRATDPIIDRLVDAETARAKGRVTFWRRVANDLGAAADAVCADAASSRNTALNRARAVLDAVAAASKADAALGKSIPAASAPRRFTR